MKRVSLSHSPSVQAITAPNLLAGNASPRAASIACRIVAGSGPACSWRSASRAAKSQFRARAWAVHRKQLVDEDDNALGRTLAGAELMRFEELAPSMRPTAGMHQSRPTHANVGGVAVGLQQPFEIAQECLGALPPASQQEVEHHIASRSAALP